MLCIETSNFNPTINCFTGLYINNRTGDDWQEEYYEEYFLEGLALNRVMPNLIRGY